MPGTLDMDSRAGSVSSVLDTRSLCLGLPVPLLKRGLRLLGLHRRRGLLPPVRVLLQRVRDPTRVVRGQVLGQAQAAVIAADSVEGRLPVMGRRLPPTRRCLVRRQWQRTIGSPIRRKGCGVECTS